MLNWLLGNGDAHLKNFGVLYNWYSKAWWPRKKIEEFAQTYGRLAGAETTRMFERACEALDTGLKSARRLGKQIPGFLPLSERLRALWVERRAALRAQ